MEKEKLSTLSSSLIWFGAAISIAEILTGAMVAPLGFKMGLLSILLGHAIGGVLFYLAGYIGAQTKKSAMESARISFGHKGAILFSSLNILQLIGWAAVLIASGAVSANLLLDVVNTKIWSLVLTVLIIIWVMVGIKNLKNINILAITALFIFTLMLSNIIFSSDVAYVSNESITFGQAVELSVVMPLSWLPLISDYTRLAKNGKRATAFSAIAYFIGSCWMYVIGMGASLYAGSSDIAHILKIANLAFIGLFIVLFSTVTSNFVAVYSAGVSYVSINEKANEKVWASVVTVIAFLVAILVPMSAYENFLYFIASVFSPMAAILLTDYFILKKDYSVQSVNVKNLILWLVGFIIYRVALEFDTPIGTTLPTMVVICLICIGVDRITSKKND